MIATFTPSTKGGSISGNAMDMKNLKWRERSGSGLREMYLENDGYFNLDITFCDEKGCPFEECQRHLKNLEGKPGVIVSISKLGDICDKYKGYKRWRQQQRL